MSTCTDLINSINAVVVNPSLLASVDPTTIATLDHTIATTETAFQLVGGGAAVLSLASAPSVDGKHFKVIVAGKSHQDEGVHFSLFAGSSATLGSDSRITTSVSQINLVQPISGRDANFFAVFDFVWDSVSQFLSGYASYVNSQGIFTSTLSINQVSVASQSDLKFVAASQFAANDSYNLFTLTQFDAVLA